MTKFFNKFKKPCFWPIFGLFSNFRGKIFLENPAVMHNFKWVSNTMLKFRKKTMIQFQENAWTDGRTDGRMDRHYFMRPFRLPLRVQKVKPKDNFSE